MAAITHKGDYLLLALIVGGYLMAVMRFQATPQYLLIATGVCAALYVCWGIFHHVRSRSLHPKVVLEYFLVAALAVAIIATLLI
jgi:hypothetical protein